MDEVQTRLRGPAHFSFIIHSQAEFMTSREFHCAPAKILCSTSGVAQLAGQLLTRTNILEQCKERLHGHQSE